MSPVSHPHDAVVVARSLTKKFGDRTVVCGIDLTIPAAAVSVCSDPMAQARPPRCA
jgi:ABC-type transporter Mla maintaining outer membrane lipid asymmetry ATPase subunit MlaF